MKIKLERRDLWGYALAVLLLLAAIAFALVAHDKRSTLSPLSPLVCRNLAPRPTDPAVRRQTPLKCLDGRPSAPDSRPWEIAAIVSGAAGLLVLGFTVTGSRLRRRDSN